MALAVSVRSWPHTRRGEGTASSTALVVLGFVAGTTNGSGNVADYVRKSGRGRIFDTEEGLLAFLGGDEAATLAVHIRHERAAQTATVTMSDMR